MITVVIGKIIHGVVVLGSPTIQEGDGKIMMGLSIYGVGVISRSLYSRFYGIAIYIFIFIFIFFNIYQAVRRARAVNALRANVGPAG